MGEEHPSPAGDIGGRYRVVRSLGKGGGGETFEALRLADGVIVALKCLVVAQTRDWKTVELFEREARVLASLNHPAIPRYEDSFVVESARGTELYLVHHFAPGRSLREWVAQGWHPDEAEVLRITEFLLDVLAYLHALAPPVVHRDIKPDNIIRSDDGRLWLVDFGAVRDFTSTISGGSTVVGTYGYMAPEQFRGQAVPASDIYGVAATLLFLLTGRPPTELPQEKLKVVFRPYVHGAPKLVAWLDRALEPAPEDRFASAQLALHALRTGPAPAAIATPRAPSRSRVAFLGLALVAVLLAAGAIGIVELRSHRRATAAAAAATTAKRHGPLPPLPRRPEGSAQLFKLQQNFKGHTALILALAISPDDKTLATGSDGSVKLWDVQSGEALRTLGGIDGRVGSLAFAKDGTQLVTGSATTLRVWDVAKGTQLRAIEKAHGSDILDMAMAPDGKTFFTASKDGNVKAWDFESGREQRVFAHGSPCYAVAVSPDGRWLATGAADGSLKRWNLATGDLAQTSKEHTKTIDSIAFSPDGALLATGSDDRTAIVWGVDRNGTVDKRYSVQHRDEVWGVTFSPDGRLFVTASRDQVVRVVEPLDGQVLTSSALGVGAGKVAFARDSRSLLVSAGEWAVRYSVSFRRSGTKLPDPPAEGPLVPVTHNRDEELYVEAMRLMMHWSWSIKEAEAKIDEATKLNPASHLASVARAQLILKRAYKDGTTYDPVNTALAQKELERAATLGKKGPEWWSVRAWVARAQKDAGAAHEAVRQTYLLVPNEPYAALADAKLARDESRTAAALAILTKLITSTRRPEILNWAYGELADGYRRPRGGDRCGAERARDAPHRRRRGAGFHGQRLGARKSARWRRAVVGVWR